MLQSFVAAVKTLTLALLLLLAPWSACSVGPPMYPSCFCSSFLFPIHPLRSASGFSVFFPGGASMFFPSSQSNN